MKDTLVFNTSASYMKHVRGQERRVNLSAAAAVVVVCIRTLTYRTHMYR